MRIARAGIFAVVLALGIAAQWSRAPDVFVRGGVYFLDPDCYSRMTRAALIESGQGLSLQSHDFENAPVGTRPHTTAPLDLLIVGLAAGLRVAGLEPARDLAGAWVSPVLGIGFLAVVAWWAWGRKFGSLALLVAAVSPILAHSFSVGRPDHQSLLLVLLAPVLLLELRLWSGGGFRPVVSGVLWA
ncbi:MAG: hypothetical protein N2322_03465, partial [Terrimicrobiaceae bacterium]|nr:hypothetical protein [Terrimicrobiaceae bacterium]